MLINIIGSGVVGTATGKGLQDKGHDVRFHDISEQRLQELEQMGLWVTRTFPDDGDMTMICVSTPNTEKGIIDLTDVMEATREVATHLLHGYHLVVVRSTIPPTTAERTLLPILETYSGKKVDADFGLCVQPEFLRSEGGHDPYWDFTHPWFIVIGEHDARAGDILEGVYQPFAAPIAHVDMKTAEMIKYVHNLFNATKISLFNEIHSIEKKLGIDSDLVHSIVARTAEGMWRPEYGIKGGYPYGGSCLPKDTVAFLNFAREHGLGQMPLLRATIEVNSRLLRESLRREEGSAISGR